MTESSTRASAKIYAFPTRTTAQSKGSNGLAKTHINAVDARYAAVSYGSWYHEEAVQEVVDQQSIVTMLRRN